MYTCAYDILTIKIVVETAMRSSLSPTMPGTYQDLRSSYTDLSVRSPTDLRTSYTETVPRSGVNMGAWDQSVYTVPGSPMHQASGTPMLRAAGSPMASTYT